jgi:ubiquinone/menaquinone biosynthesis C-methylase UbiE
MNETPPNINEQKIAVAFTKQSFIFDKIDRNNPVIQYKRERIRNHATKYLNPASYILELNSGTGEDAVWFAQQGHRVHATDISKGMLEVLAQKVKSLNMESSINHELCSFTELYRLEEKGPFDFIFSNFAGLNCTNELDKVLHSLSSLLKPKGVVTLVILPKFCLWEFLLLFKGKFKTAFRRFFSSEGRKAHIEDQDFLCWYYSPAYVISNMENEFDLLNLEGLCSLVPPSYLENFPKKHPRIYQWLKVKEKKWKNKWPWKYIGDYFIISFRKKNQTAFTAKKDFNSC